MKKILCCMFLAFLCHATGVYAQPNFSSRVIKDGLFVPWELVYGPDDRIWFTQKNGYVCRLDPLNGQMDTVYFEGQSVIRGEGGMLGLALQPDFGNDPYVFVAYEYEEGNAYKERVVKFRYVNGTLQMPQILIDNITGAAIHNGCRLAIVDDKLFVSTGDAGNAPLAQNTTSLNGKVLRINLDGSIPDDNPIPGSAVWSWGHRNAQGLAFHNGVLYSSEHGANSDDEVNAILKGRNYGWPKIEGFCNLPAEMQFCADSNIVEPLYAWTPTLGVSGMAYYNHPMFPDLANSLLLTTLKDNNLYKLSLTAAGDSIVQILDIPGIDYGRLRAITVAPDGRIFLSTSNSNAAGTGEQVDKIIELYDAAVTDIFAQYRNNNMLMVYPNPVVDVMNISFLEEGRAEQQWQYTITDIQGTVLQEGRLEFSSLNLGQLDSGVYFLKMWNEKKEIAFKQFVKW